MSGMIGPVRIRTIAAVCAAATVTLSGCGQQPSSSAHGSAPSTAPAAQGTPTSAPDTASHGLSMPCNLVLGVNSAPLTALTLSNIAGVYNNADSAELATAARAFAASRGYDLPDRHTMQMDCAAYLDRVEPGPGSFKDVVPPADELVTN
jgi:hypothetical protein